jgi:hypothetical protein
MEKYTQEFTTSNGDSRERFADSKRTAVLEIIGHHEIEVVGVIRSLEHKATRLGQYDDGASKVVDSELVWAEEKIMWHDGRFLVRCDPDDYSHKPEISRYHSPDIAFARWRKAIVKESDSCSGSDIHWVYCKPFFYAISEEPRYVVNTFGFNNGTAIFVERHYNTNIVPEHYFHAKDLPRAMKLARKLKEMRGDKDASVHGRIRMFKPEVFKVSPKKGHPGSDDFTKDMTGIVTSGMDKTVGAFALMALALRDRS